MWIFSAETKRPLSLKRNLKHHTAEKNFLIIFLAPEKKIAPFFSLLCLWGILKEKMKCNAQGGVWALTYWAPGPGKSNSKTQALENRGNTAGRDQRLRHWRVEGFPPFLTARKGVRPSCWFLGSWWSWESSAVFERDSVQSKFLGWLLFFHARNLKPWLVFSNCTESQWQREGEGPDKQLPFRPLSSQTLSLPLDQ